MTTPPPGWLAHAGTTPEPVIKAARRHRRRRWLAAEVAMAVLAAVIAGSGGGGGRAGSTGPVTWLSPVPVPRGAHRPAGPATVARHGGTPIQGTLVVTYRGDAPLNLTRLNRAEVAGGPRLFCRPQFYIALTNHRITTVFVLLTPAGSARSSSDLESTICPSRCRPPTATAGGE